MTLWKAWFDVRRRFYLCVVLITLLVAPHVMTAAVRAALGPTSQAAVDTRLVPEGQEPTSALHRAVEDWIAGRAYLTFAVLATVLSVGGITAQTTASSNLMTLSLPEHRRRWITAHAGLATLLVTLLCLWEVAIIAVAGWAAGVDVPVSRLAVAVLLTAASGSIWIWPSILLTSVTRDSIRAALIVVSVIVALSSIVAPTGIAFLDLQRIAGVSNWRSGLPWQPIALAFSMTAAAAWAALRRFDRMEY